MANTPFTLLLYIIPPAVFTLSCSDGSVALWSLVILYAVPSYKPITARLSPRLAIVSIVYEYIGQQYLGTYFVVWTQTNRASTVAAAKQFQLCIYFLEYFPEDLFSIVVAMVLLLPLFLNSLLNITDYFLATMAIQYSQQMIIGRRERRHQNGKVFHWLAVLVVHVAGVVVLEGVIVVGHFAIVVYYVVLWLHVEMVVLLLHLIDIIIMDRLDQCIQHLQQHPSPASSSFHLLYILLGPQFLSLFFDPLPVCQLIAPFQLHFSVYQVDGQLVKQYASMYHCSCKTFNQLCLIKKHKLLVFQYNYRSVSMQSHW